MISGSQAPQEILSNIEFVKFSKSETQDVHLEDRTQKIENLHTTIVE